MKPNPDPYLLIRFFIDRLVISSEQSKVFLLILVFLSILSTFLWSFKHCAPSLLNMTAPKDDSYLDGV
jgi:hypothetical protein